MKKKSASKSAFFNPRVLIGLAFCVIGLVLALLAFALYPGGNVLAKGSQQNQSDCRRTENLAGRTKIKQGQSGQGPDAEVSHVATRIGNLQPPAPRLFRSWSERIWALKLSRTIRLERPTPLGRIPKAKSGEIIFPASLASAGADDDWYSFTTTVASSKIYAAVVTSCSAAAAPTAFWTLIASDGTTVLETDHQDGSFGASSSSIAGTTLAAAGTYYLRVTNFSTTAPIAPYDLYFAVRSGAPTAETEPNNNGTPQALPVSQYVSGVIDPVGDTDTFTFTANAGDTVFISLDLDPERDVYHL